MHETAIAKKIIEEAEKRAGKKRIKSITIEVGDLAHLPANELREFMKNITDYEVRIVSKKAMVRCKCGYEGEPGILAHEHDFALYECPECGSTPKVLSGEDIVLKEITTA